jgi:hypothetical protein
LIERIETLKQKKTDWARFYGNLHEAVVVLSALITITVGTRSLISPLLMKVKEKIEAAQVVIETSIVNQQFIQIQSKSGEFLIQQIDNEQIGHIKETVDK